MSYETVRQWCLKFGGKYAWNLRRRQRRKSDIWHLDEVFVTIKRNKPHRPVTDKLRSYSVAHRDVLPSVTHDTRQYANNRAEVSHQPTRQRERSMRGFKTIPAPAAPVHH